jgi:hypothetical protein
MPRDTRSSIDFDSAVASDDRVVFRFAGESDASALEWLRQRDTAVLPPPPHLVAEVDGTIRAARSMRTGETIADPFTHTTHLRDMLAARASLFEVRPRRHLAVRFARRLARGEAW